MNISSNFSAVLLTAIWITFINALSLTTAHAEFKGLPPAPEWKPGNIRRGEDGNLYMEQTTPAPAPKAEPKITPQKQTPTAKQEPPKNVKTLYKDHITLTWQKPLENTDGSPLTDLAGYKIYYWKHGETKKKVVDVENKTSHTFNNLDYGEIYWFAITAYSKKQLESGLSQSMAIKLERPQ